MSFTDTETALSMATDTTAKADIRQLLWSSLSSPSSSSSSSMATYLAHEREEAVRIKGLLDVAFTPGGKSTALIIMGPEDSGKQRLLDDVLSSYHVLSSSDVDADEDEDENEDDDGEKGCTSPSLVSSSRGSTERRGGDSGKRGIDCREGTEEDRMKVGRYVEEEGGPSTPVYHLNSRGSPMTGEHSETVSSPEPPGTDGSRLSRLHSLTRHRTKEGEDWGLEDAEVATPLRRSSSSSSSSSTSTSKSHSSEKLTTPTSSLKRTRQSTPDVTKRIKHHEHEQEPLNIARIRGSVDENDQKGLVALAAQFKPRKPGNSSQGSKRPERNFITNLDSLEGAFQYSKFDKRPTVIVIEDIHIYASSSRQVLLYAILDLLHRRDLLFCLIGLTDRYVHTYIHTYIHARTHAYSVLMLDTSFIPYSFSPFCMVHDMIELISIKCWRNE